MEDGHISISNMVGIGRVCGYHCRKGWRQDENILPGLPHPAHT